MALGDSNYSSERKSNKEKIVISQYSDYSASNKDGVVASSRLSYAFYGGTLKITIAPRDPQSSDEKPSYNYQNAGNIYLQHTKCRILRDAILEMKNNPSIHNVGVPSKDKLISFSDGTELGIETPALIIREISEDGTPTSVYIYEFKNNFHYSVVNFNDKDASFDKNYHTDLEVDQFIEILDSYIKAMTGAQAYVTLDMFTNADEAGNVLRNVASQVGVPENTSRANYRQQNSYFNNNGNINGSFRQANINDLRSA